MDAVFPILLAIGLTGYAVLLVLIAQARATIGRKLRGFGPLLIDTLLGMIFMLFVLFALTVVRQVLHLDNMGALTRWALTLGFVSVPWIAVIRWFRWRRSPAEKDDS